MIESFKPRTALTSMVMAASLAGCIANPKSTKDSDDQDSGRIIDSTIHDASIADDVQAIIDAAPVEDAKVPPVNDARAPDMLLPDASPHNPCDDVPRPEISRRELVTQIVDCLKVSYAQCAFGQGEDKIECCPIENYDDLNREEQRVQEYASIVCGLNIIVGYPDGQMHLERPLNSAEFAAVAFRTLVLHDDTLPDGIHGGNNENWYTPYYHALGNLVPPGEEDCPTFPPSTQFIENVFSKCSDDSQSAYCEDNGNLPFVTRGESLFVMHDAAQRCRDQEFPGVAPYPTGECPENDISVCCQTARRFENCCDTAQPGEFCEIDQPQIEAYVSLCKSQLIAPMDFENGQFCYIHFAGGPNGPVTSCFQALTADHNDCFPMLDLVTSGEFACIAQGASQLPSRYVESRPWNESEICFGSLMAWCGDGEGREQACVIPEHENHCAGNLLSGEFLHNEMQVCR